MDVHATKMHARFFVRATVWHDSLNQERCEMWQHTVSSVHYDEGEANVHTHDV